MRLRPSLPCPRADVRCPLACAVSLTRKALADYTFADGTFIPAGTTVSAPLRATHYDDGIWARAAVFDPWRFSTLREAEGESAKHHMVSTSTEYLAFGHGQHAWYVSVFSHRSAGQSVLTGVCGSAPAAFLRRMR